MKASVYDIVFDGKRQYVGSARNPDGRLRMHIREGRVPESARVEVVAWFPNSKTAKQAETLRIKKYMPPLNVACAKSDGRTASVVKERSRELYMREIEIKAAAEKKWNEEFEADCIEMATRLKMEGKSFDEIHEKMGRILDVEMIECWMSGRVWADRHK